MKAIIEHNLKEYKDLCLIDTNKKFRVKIDEKFVIIESNSFSSLRAGVNAVLKELIILENLKKLK
jgi:hypothetical protein